MKCCVDDLALEVLLECSCVHSNYYGFPEKLANNSLSSLVSPPRFNEKHPHLSQMTEGKKRNQRNLTEKLNVISQAKLKSTPGNSSPNEKLELKM